MLALVLALVAGSGCFETRRTVLGPGGRPVSSVREGTWIDAQFAAPRRLEGRTAAETRRLPRDAIRVTGTVERVRGDSVYVDVETAAPLGGEPRAVSPSVRVPVVMNRDVAVRLREYSPRTTTLLGLAIGGAVLVIFAATR